jgi:uncharacterized protein YndB with AHSA1/START domain
MSFSSAGQRHLCVTALVSDRLRQMPPSLSVMMTGGHIRMPASVMLATFVGANVEDIYLALTTTNGLASFWTSNVETEPTEPTIGGVIRFGRPGNARAEARVQALEPNRRAVWTLLNDAPQGAPWTGSIVNWELTRIEHLDTLVNFQQTNWPEGTTQADLARVTYIWAQILRALKDYTETGKAQPHFGGAAVTQVS